MYFGKKSYLKSTAAKHVLDPSPARFYFELVWSWFFFLSRQKKNIHVFFWVKKVDSGVDLWLTCQYSV